MFAQSCRKILRSGHQISWRARLWSRVHRVCIRTPGFLWQSVELHNEAIVDLSNAGVGLLLDDQESWPRPGNLLIHSLIYDNFGAGAPVDARTRLQWFSLQSGGFRPQAYRDRPKCWRTVAMKQERRRFASRQRIYGYASRGPLARVWGGFLKWTIGYRHRPMLTVMWSLAVVLLGLGGRSSGPRLFQ